MRLHDRKLFKDTDKLSHMLNLRMQGWTLESLAIYFKCHKTSVEAQCDKYGVIPLEPTVGVESMGRRIMSRQVFKIADGEVICRGKSYADYLKDSKYPTTNLVAR